MWRTEGKAISRKGRKLKFTEGLLCRLAALPTIQLSLSITLVTDEVIGNGPNG